MKTNFKKVICVMLAGLLLLSVSGCKKDNTAATNSKAPKGEVSYPIDTDVTLTYWVRLVAALGTSVKNYSETPFAQEYMKRTGINVKYLHPAQGSESESLNLLIASGDLPDIIETNWLSRDPDSSISKKTILRLNDIFDNYAPNVKKYLAENADIDRTVRTDESNYYVFPFIRGDERLCATSGLMIRNDWLEELNLEVPTTISEWEDTLKLFKDKKNAVSPLAMGVNQLYTFAGAFGITKEFYIDNGKVRYGEAEPAFKDYLILMNKWYNEGLIDKNFAIMDNKIVNANVLDNKSGATQGAGGSGMGMYLNAKAGQDDKFDLVAAPFPTINKGDTPEFGEKQLPYSPLNGAAITGKCENPEIAARFLDYSYSQDGYMLNNFGIEGTSYNTENGYPKFTALITENPDKLSMAQALPLYVRSANEGPFVQDVRYIEQYYKLPQQKAALDTWSNNNHEKHIIPQITLTQDEVTEFNKIMPDIRTFKDENILNFILGTEPISNFDSYIAKFKELKLDRAIEIEQAAYDRFTKRN